MESKYDFDYPTLTLLTRINIDTKPKPNATLDSEVSLRTMQGSKKGSFALKGLAFTTITACGDQVRDGQRWRGFQDTFHASSLGFFFG
jgi:hypothetical protein